MSLACRWASRTLIFRKLKALEDAISLSVVDPYMGENGWTFTDGPGCLPDSIFNARYLHEIYTAADPHYTGRVTVPVLWDKKAATIVNFYPAELRGEIDSINELVYPTLTTGLPLRLRHHPRSETRGGVAARLSGNERIVLVWRADRLQFLVQTALDSFDFSLLDPVAEDPIRVSWRG